MKTLIIGAGAAILAIVISACGSASGSAAPGGPSVSSTGNSPAGNGSPTIGPSIPADGPFGIWWNANNDNPGAGGMGQNDALANDLHQISQDRNIGGVSSDVPQADGQGLATDSQKAEANPPPYYASDYQQAMADYVTAGNDYANGDTPAGDAEVQVANAVLVRWGRIVQPYCPNGGDCVDTRSYLPTGSPSP
jgi:hypothetical protein